MARKIFFCYCELAIMSTARENHFSDTMNHKFALDLMSSFVCTEITSPTIAGSEENRKYTNIPNSTGSLVDVSLSTPVPDGMGKTPTGFSSSIIKKSEGVCSNSGYDANPMMASLDVSASSYEEYCLPTPMLSEEVKNH